MGWVGMVGVTAEGMVVAMGMAIGRMVVLCMEALMGAWTHLSYGKLR